MQDYLNSLHYVISGKTWINYVISEGDEGMRKEYTAFRCRECGTVFIIPDEYIDLSLNYLTCPNHGQHRDIVVCGAYDDLERCMADVPKPR